MTVYGVDTSHHQPLGDFKRMKASGRCDFLFAKATEGVGYADPQYAASRSGAKAAGMVFGSYHFARPGDPVAQANYYLSVAKPVAGEIPVLDMEDTAIPDAGNWSAAFSARIKQVTGTAPMLYTYPNFLATHDFRPVVALGCPLWFADYSDPLNSIKPWSSYAIRQFTDRGSVPGQPGTLDCNSSPLTLDQLRALAIGAQEDDMPLTDADVEKIWNYSIAKRGGYGPGPAWVWLADGRIGIAGVGGAVAKLAAQDPTQVTAADIAAAIPPDIAQQVVDALVKRLAAAS